MESFGLKEHGWSFKSCKERISNAREINEISRKIGFDCPEMLFGSNFVQIEHEKSGFKISFSALDALRKVLRHDDPNDKLGNDDECIEESSKYEIKPVKVIHAKSWFGREDSIIKDESGDKENLIKTLEKPFDWTFTTTFTGTLESRGNSIRLKDKVVIDYDRLKVPEPILFFTENVLFEDELGDNGESKCFVKLRVMKSGFFLLHRFYLRVDQVIYRIFDTRIYHSFSNNSNSLKVYKEVRLMESLHEDLLENERFPLDQDLRNSIFLDSNALSQYLLLKQMHTDVIDLYP